MLWVFCRKVRGVVSGRQKSDLRGRRRLGSFKIITGSEACLNRSGFHREVANLARAESFPGISLSKSPKPSASSLRDIHFAGTDGCPLRQRHSDGSLFSSPYAPHLFPAVLLTYRPAPVPAGLFCYVSFKNLPHGKGVTHLINPTLFPSTLASFSPAARKPRQILNTLVFSAHMWPPRACAVGTIARVM